MTCYGENTWCPVPEVKGQVRSECYANIVFRRVASLSELIDPSGIVGCWTICAPQRLTPRSFKATFGSNSGTQCVILVTREMSRKSTTPVDESRLSHYPERVNVCVFFFRSGRCRLDKVTYLCQRILTYFVLARQERQFDYLFRVSKPICNRRPHSCSVIRQTAVLIRKVLGYISQTQAFLSVLVY